MSLLSLIIPKMRRTYLKPYATKMIGIDTLTGLHKFRSSFRSFKHDDFLRLQRLADIRAREIREQLPDGTFAEAYTCHLSDDQLDRFEIGWMLPCGFFFGDRNRKDHDPHDS